LDFRSIAIIGSGAVGGYYGARLAQHGHDVHFLLRSDYAAVREHGWTIQSCDGDFTVPAQRVHAYDTPERMPKVDLVVVTLKATANDQFSRLITPLLHDRTAILTLQNGLGNEEMLAELFGAGRILGGLAFTCINRIGPGKIHHMDHGLIRLGEFRGPGRSDRATAIARLFNDSQIHAQVLDNLRYGRWEKLVWNVPFNGLGALMDMTTDQLLASEEGVSLLRQLMSEVVATAKAVGIELPAGIIDLKIDQTRTMGAYQTSMQIDRKLGRPLETEAILGRALREAQQRSIPTPAIRMVYSLLIAAAAS
jgi:2-dehydropantoate 2-reductase